MATIHQARNSVVSLIYAYDLGTDDIQVLKEEFFDEKKIRNKQKIFADSLFNGILKNLDYIDKSILENSKGRTFAELGKIEKAVLRVGVYEIKFTSTDKAIVINEALELMKDFGIEEAIKFINAVLDSL